MKYKPRLKVYKSSTGKNVYNPETRQAYSYDWWRYVDFKKGKVIFNNASYSKTTNKHQSECRSLLKELGIKIDFELNVEAGLQAVTKDSVMYLIKMAMFEDIKASRSYKYSKNHVSEVPTIIEAASLYKIKILKKELKALKIEAELSDAKRRERAKASRDKLKAIKTKYATELNSTESINI